MNSMKACLKQGLGITVCPEVAYAREIADGELSCLKWEVRDAETSVIMIWHAQKWCSPLLKQFLRIAEEVLSGPQ